LLFHALRREELCERRGSGEQKYYLANLPAKAGLKTLAATIKARWICEQAHHGVPRDAESEL